MPCHSSVHVYSHADLYVDVLTNTYTHTLGSLYRSLKELAETKLLDGTGRKPHYRCDKLL